MNCKNLLFLLLSIFFFLTACTEQNKENISFNINTTQDKQREVILPSATDEEKAKSAFIVFAEDFQTAIVNNERAALASLCRFPFEFIESKEEFISNFDTYFNANLLKALEKITIDNWVKQDNRQILTIDYDNNKAIFQAVLKGDKYYLNEISIIDKNK